MYYNNCNKHNNYYFAYYKHQSIFESLHEMSNSYKENHLKKEFFALSLYKSDLC